MSSREAQRDQWLKTALQTPDLPQLTAVSGDASFRQYFRVKTGQHSYIIMDAPPEHEDCKPFVAIANAWRKHHINVPQVLNQDLENGFLLLSDFGDHLYLHALNADTADALYRKAIHALLRIQRTASPPTYPLPLYDRALLQREMALFKDWLVVKKLEISLTERDKDMLDQVFDTLINSALSQPRVTVHRDYHSRNLMITDDDQPGILDFQDAVLGPVTYDIVSLLRDCYIQWPDAQLSEWLEYYWQASIDAGLQEVSFNRFRQWFDFMGMQRHLKASGIFARLDLRDNKPGYLRDIPRTINYIVSAARQHPSLEAFSNWLDTCILPRIEELAHAEGVGL